MLAALYVSACATATREKPVASATPAPAAAVPAQPQATLGAVPPISLETATLPPGSMPLPTADHPAPHIALLLPLKSAAFASAADAVQQGFMAASSKQTQGTLPVRAYGTSDDTRDIITQYRQALANGAVAVAGPLTRDGVAVLAAYPEIAVPTLALNITDTKPSSNKLYFYSLTADTEARQVAQLAFKAKYRDATIVTTASPLSKRLSAVFAAEWKALGGNVTAEVLYNNDPSALADLPVAPWPPGMTPPEPVYLNADGEPTAPKRPLPPPAAPSNVVFLAADSATARLVRPYFNPSLPVYGTSQLFRGNGDTLTNYDLNDIRFVDMPWMVQPENAAVQFFPHANPPLEADMERLYALGVDAFRLLQVMRQNNPRALPLDGVTGRISLKENTFQRESLPALFRVGRGLTPDALNALNAARAAEKAAEIAARKAAEKAAGTTAPAK
ncbi:MAG TPA: penicillin-binding protein activator [Gallionellaceae bacterium]|nr:penicillin-binding protein activator [Gallionellaceae bacterium]